MLVWHWVGPLMSRLWNRMRLLLSWDNQNYKLVMTSKLFVDTINSFGFTLKFCITRVFGNNNITWSVKLKVCCCVSWFISRVVPVLCSNASIFVRLWKNIDILCLVYLNFCLKKYLKTIDICWATLDIFVFRAKIWKKYKHKISIVPKANKNRLIQTKTNAYVTTLFISLNFQECTGVILIIFRVRLLQRGPWWKLAMVGMKELISYILIGCV